MARAVDGRAWLRALCDVEAAHARACATVGLIALPDALEVARACAELARTDPSELGHLSVVDGNPVVPLARKLKALAPAAHRGLTSQDVLDTAAMLLSQRALGLIVAALTDAADAAARLASEHRSTPTAARTLLQQALPTTFGALAATWGAGLDQARTRLVELQASLPVQLGGAAGTLAALYPHGPAIRAALAEELDLADPGRVWHAERSIVGALAGSLGLACGVVGKVATDIILLAQTELAEVHEATGGASSAMPHKANPIAAITARAAAAQGPGLVATLLTAMSGELQRGAGPWHAEWQPLSRLLIATGGAAARGADALSGLRVDVRAMRRNLDATGGRLLAEQVAVHLGRELVEQAAAAPDFRAALSEYATSAQLERWLDPSGYLGHAADLVDDYLRGRPT